MPLLVARQAPNTAANDGAPVQPGQNNAGGNGRVPAQAPSPPRLASIIVEDTSSNDNGMSRIAAVEPPTTIERPLLQNRGNSASSPSPPPSSDVDPGLAVRPDSSDVSKAGGLSTSAIIGLSVSLVAVGLLVGLLTMMVVRRRRSRQSQGPTPPPRSSSTHHEDGKRAAGRISPTAGMAEANAERFAARPTRSSSLVRGSTAAVGSSPPRTTPRIIAEETHVEIVVDDKMATAAAVPLPASPPQLPASAAGADAWGVPANRQSGWPAHLSHPMAQQATALMTARSVPGKTPSPPAQTFRTVDNASPSPDSPAVETTAAPIPMLAALHLPTQPGATADTHDASLKRVHSVRSRGPSMVSAMAAARSVSHPPGSRVSGEEVWDESSMWSDSAVERFYPPRQSLTTFCNTASAAAAVAAAQAEAKRANTLQQLNINTERPETSREAQRRSMADLAVAVAAMNDDDNRSLAGSMAFSEDDGTVAEELQRMLNAEYRARHPGLPLLPVVAERSPIITTTDPIPMMPEPPMSFIPPTTSGRVSPMIEALGIGTAAAPEDNELAGILNVSVEKRHSNSPLPSTMPQIEMPRPQSMETSVTAERLIAQSSSMETPPTVRDSIATTVSYTDSNDSRPQSQYVTTAQKVNLAMTTMDTVRVPNMPVLPQDIPLPPEQSPLQSQSPVQPAKAPQQIPLPVSRDPSPSAP